MIDNDDQLTQAKEALTRLETAVRALRARIVPASPGLFEAMAEDYRANILQIRSEIDQYIGLETAGEGAVPLWMVLEGEAISPREISSRLLSEWLDRFRKALYGVAAYIETGLLRSGGRPDAALLAMTDLHVVALAPGSIRVGMRLPPTVTQAELFATTEERAHPIPYRALEALISVASWAASNDIQPPVITVANRDALSVAARFAARLAPSPRSTVRAVSFSGALVLRQEPLRLTAESRTRLEGLVKVLSHEAEETIAGQVREIDLDQQRVILRERGPGMPDVKCLLPIELVQHAAGLLNRHVKVRGLVSSGTPDTISVHAIDEADVAK